MWKKDSDKIAKRYFLIIMHRRKFYALYQRKQCRIEKIKENNFYWFTEWESPFIHTIRNKNYAKKNFYSTNILLLRENVCLRFLSYVNIILIIY